jgi:tetratricopeptide (TPR) repeat protein
MAKYLWFFMLLACAPAQAGTTLPSDELLAKAKQAYEHQGPAVALPLFEKVLTTYHAANDRHGEAMLLGYIAICHRGLGNLNQALELGKRALAMKEELGDRLEAGKTHNQLGLIYWDMADYPSAMEHLEQAIDIGRSLGDVELEGSAVNNLGLVLDERGEYQ